MLFQNIGFKRYGADKMYYGHFWPSIGNRDLHLVGMDLGIAQDTLIQYGEHLCVELFQNRPISLTDMEQTENIELISDLWWIVVTLTSQLQTWVLRATHQLNMVNILVRLFDRQTDRFQTNGVNMENGLTDRPIISPPTDICKTIYPTIFEMGIIND